MEYLAPSEGFLGLDNDSNLEQPKVVVVPYGLEASVSYGSGTAKGPAAILEASRQVELFDEELLCEPWREYGIATLKEHPITKNLPEAISNLGGIVEKILEQKQFPLILGGEHSLTAGVIKPFLTHFPDLAILHFDAHADLRDGYDGEHFSHAAALRRCLDHPVKKLVSLGIRNISAEEFSYYQINKNRISIYWAHEKANWNLDEIIAELAGKPVYLTFDLDGFDASLMSATGTPEPGGLFWDDVIPVIREVSRNAQLVGADVVELAPKPNLHACDFLAAKLCYKILNFAFSSH